MQSEEEVRRKHFRNQLAACVRGIQWSYGIFWSMSTLQEGLLEWNDGFYNGDIRTRKTTQLTEPNTDQIGLQTSEQLRELYESLSTDDSNEPNLRPSTSLSPEDLTDTEWYYVVCMSFTFGLGQDLPGKVYKRKESVWLSNVQFAENKNFCRCLLARSASIQTVVGLPFMDGVLELGTSELVLEDLSFVQSITNSFWEFQIHGVDDPILFENNHLITENDSIIFSFDVNSYSSNNHIELMHTNVTDLHPSNCEKIVDTSEVISNAHDDLSRIERLNEPSHVHTRHFMDEEFSNDIHASLNSRDFASWPFAESIISSPTCETMKGNMLNHLQEDDHAKDYPSENGFDKTSFKIWKREIKSKDFSVTPQRMLKKILLDSKWMNGSQLVKSQEENGSRDRAWKSEADTANVSHVLSERRRRVKLNEKFLVLRSLVPSISKVDKASILTDTIEYLKELERKIEELESCNEEDDPDTRARRKYPDIAERTSKHNDNNKLNKCQKPSTNKKKACKIDEREDENNWLLPKDGIVDINITIIEEEVLVEMQCPWRNFLLLDIIEGMKRLHLDAQSVQSSNVDGILAITLRAKFMNKVTASPGMIKRALQRLVGRCQ